MYQDAYLHCLPVRILNADVWVQSPANDLSNYLPHIWLSPEPSPLITIPQRRRNLRSNYALPDGKQLVGAGWKIDLISADTSNSTSALEKSYASYGKAGDGGRRHAWIDVIPNLGYGIVVLSQHSGLPDYVRIVPTSIRDTVHEISMPAFAEALTDRLKDRFVGWYAKRQRYGYH